DLLRRRGGPVDEGLLDRSFVGRMGGHDIRQPVMKLAEPACQIGGLVGLDRARSYEPQNVADGLDDTPARAPQARVDTDDANRRHCPTLPRWHSHASGL